ncbi:hypothetical protein BDN72DRAFT_305000 [Pluteus cervinus]|uniref:Uncharacterized protein n=1 Tax=Pluteus cervinus TaxID=181527 RepID=A0ACD3B3W2_9AGAR|nr:hypothetical protein BDN72DRAFT_305000 [Pluteus cervinus]
MTISPSYLKPPRMPFELPTRASMVLSRCLWFVLSFPTRVSWNICWDHEENYSWWPCDGQFCLFSSVFLFNVFHLSFCILLLLFNIHFISLTRANASFL